MPLPKKHYTWKTAGSHSVLYSLFYSPEPRYRKSAKARFLDQPEQEIYSLKKKNLCGGIFFAQTGCHSQQKKDIKPSFGIL